MSPFGRSPVPPKWMTKTWLQKYVFFSNFSKFIFQEEIGQYKKSYNEVLIERNQFKQQCTQGKNSLFKTKKFMLETLGYFPFNNLCQYT